MTSFECSFLLGELPYVSGNEQSEHTVPFWNWTVYFFWPTDKLIKISFCVVCFSALLGESAGYGNLFIVWWGLKFHDRVKLAIIDSSLVTVAHGGYDGGWATFLASQVKCNEALGLIHVLRLRFYFKNNLCLNNCLNNFKWFGSMTIV